MSVERKMTGPDESHIGGGHGFRFDGTITLGNLLTAAVFGLGAIIWCIRLEGRVDHEQDLRARLEMSLSENVRAIRDSQAGNVARLEKTMSEESQRNKETDADFKQWMRRLDLKLDTMNEKLSAQRPAPFRENGR